MDIYDAGLLGNNGRSGNETPETTGANKTELDQNVEKMVGNISTWWSGIAKKSQESINQARQQVESQGGIVNYAKSNYAKIEASIGDAQKRAREQSSGEPNAQTTDSEAPAPSSDKGKQRAFDDQPQETPLISPSLSSSVSSLFTKLTADPRLQQLQKSLTTTLQSVSSPQQEQLNEDGTPRSPVQGGPVKFQESLAKLSLTFQSHLPHLDFKESQQLATKYLQATENFAKEIQTDMTELVGELVRIVPPEEKASEEKVGVVKEEDHTPSETTKAAPATSDPTAANDADEEDFVWDEEDEETAAAAAASKADAEAKPSQSDTKENKTASSTKAEDEEDSDWE